MVWLKELIADSAEICKNSMQWRKARKQICRISHHLCESHVFIWAKPNVTLLVSSGKLVDLPQDLCKLYKYGRIFSFVRAILIFCHLLIMFKQAYICLNCA